MEMYERIKLRMSELELKSVDVVKMAGVSKGTVSQWLNGIGKPKGENLLKLAEALQCKPEWLQFGGIRIPDVGNVDIPNTYDIPVYDIQFSAGFGSEGVDNAELETIAIPEQLLLMMKVNPAHAMIVKIKGDSMEPTLNDGESIVIDTGSSKPVSDQVYAFKFEGELKVKRFVKEYSGLWSIKSDNKFNPAYQDQSIDLSNVNGIEVIGRVAGLVGRAF